MDPDQVAGGAVGVLSAAVGLIFGSFANVCIHRIPEGESVVAPRSRCPSCGAGIAWYDNVPVVSWMLLRARCRSCRAPISGTYPIVEAIVGAGFLAAFLRFGLSIDAAAAAALVFLCVVLTVIDARLFILPDRLTLPGIALGLLFAGARAVAARGDGAGGSWLGGFFDVQVLPLASLGGAALGAAIPLVARGGYQIVRRLRGGEDGEDEESFRDPVAAGSPVGGTPDGPPAEDPGNLPASPAISAHEDDVMEAAAEEGMGLGDVKMLAMAGAFLGPRMTLVAILLGSIGGCLLVIPWLALTRRSFRTPIPFGPFIAGGAVLAAFAGEGLASWYAAFIVRLFA